MPGIATLEKMAMEQKRSSDADQQENTMKLQKHSFAAMGLAGVLAGFAGISVVQAENADMTYKAELSPLNSKTTGSERQGRSDLHHFRRPADDSCQRQGSVPRTWSTFSISTDLPRAIGSPNARRPATTGMAMGSSI